MPPSNDPPSTPGHESVLGLVKPLAAFALFAVLVGRALAPSLRGAAIGLGPVVTVTELVGSVSSQVFAAAAMMMAIFSILATSRSGLPTWLRLAALSLGGFAVLPTVWAAHEPIPEISASFVAASASLLAIATVPASRKAPYTRGPGLVIGLVASGALVRLVAVVVTLLVKAPNRFVGPALAIGGSVGFVIDGLAVAIALVMAPTPLPRGPSTSNEPPAPAPIARPATLAVVAIAAIISRLAMAGQGADASPIEIVCWRAAVRLLSAPDAAFPLALRLFVAVLAPLTGLVTLLRKGGLAPMSGAICLALTARGAIEMPPCALMIIVAALTTALTADDPRAVWANLDDTRR